MYYGVVYLRLNHFKLHQGILQEEKERRYRTRECLLGLENSDESIKEKQIQGENKVKPGT